MWTKHRAATAVAAAVALLCGGALAQAQLDGEGVIHGCVTEGLGGGGLRVVDGASACRDNERAISWNREGPAGAVGARGPTGPRGVSRVHSVALPHHTDVDLPTDGRTFVEVLGIDLPAGEYFINAHAWIHNDVFGEKTFAGCTVTAGGLFTGHNDTIDGLRTFDLPVMGVTSLPRPERLKLRCGGSGGAPQVLQASLHALQVDEIIGGPPEIPAAD